MVMPGLDEWISKEPQLTTNWFGVKRYIEAGEFKIYSDFRCSDIRRRSFGERWFSLPWKPLKKYEDNPSAYIIDKNILVSPKTFAKLLKENQDK